MRYKGDSIEERDAAVERLREFLRFNYLTGTEAARRIGVRAEALYAWLQGKSRPASAERLEKVLKGSPSPICEGVSKVRGKGHLAKPKRLIEAK